MFTPNAAGIRELLHDPAIIAEMARKAELVATSARESAPVLTGEYRDSIHVEQTADGAQVVADTDHSIYVEANTGNLARSLDAAVG